jgi:hypothetical protein
MDFVLLKDLNGYNDCSFDSKIITKIKKNTKMHKLYSNGPWIRSKYNNDLVWLYPFDKNKLIVSPITTEAKFDNNLKIGTVVYISPNQNNNLYKDRDNKLVEVIDKSERKRFFIIDSVKTTDEYYKVKSEDGLYYFANESDINNILDEDSIKLVSNIFDLQLFADGNDDKTSNSNTEKSTISFGSYDTEIIEAYNTKAKTSSTIDRAKINLVNLRSVFGLPYQYLPDADLRLNSETTSIENGSSSLLNVGMKYREKILARMPLLVMMPGVVDFMPNYSASDQNTMIKNLLSENGENYSNNKAFDFLMNKNAKTRSSYYTFYPAWSEYFNYVNKMCSAAAVFMGLSDVVLPYNSSTSGRSSDTLATYKWQYATPGSLRNTFYKGSCAFYINTDTSINETYSNSTTQSQLASKVNSYSDMARELAFISGGATDAAAKVADLATSVGGNTISTVAGGTNTIASSLAMGDATAKFKNQGLLHAILGGISNTATGAKMQFPELWQDSSFSRDYSMTIKLDSPDNDPLSVYLNIIVPLIHLTAFAAPRATGPTTYASPFLVRAYYQGFFNVNMGIISSLNITKGAEGAWTLNNIPTVAEVQVTIHDLFATQTISIDANDTNSLWGLGMLSNQPLMEYIANMCGVNYNEPEWDRLIDLATMLMKRKQADIIPRIENNIEEAIQNYSPVIYNNAITKTDVSLFSIGYNAALSKATDYAKAKIFNIG